MICSVHKSQLLQKDWMDYITSEINWYGPSVAMVTVDPHLLFEVDWYVKLPETWVFPHQIPQERKKENNQKAAVLQKKKGLGRGSGIK